MMRAATRRYGTIASLIVLAVLLLGSGIWYGNGSTQSHRLVDSIYGAKPAELKGFIDDLDRYHYWANPLLSPVANDQGAEPEKRLKASLAMLADGDSSQVPYLSDRLLDCSVDEFPVIRDFLSPYRAELGAGLWQTLHNPEQPQRHRFHAGMALSEYAPDSADWTDADFRFLADQLLGANAENQRALRSNLAGVSRHLLQPIETIFDDNKAADSVRQAAASACIDTAFAEYDPARLAELAAKATPGQYRILFDKLSAVETDLDTIRETLRKAAEEQPRENLAETERVALGKRRAGAAITLVRLGEHEAALDAFRIDDDPESLSQFVHRHKERGITPAALIECLHLATEKDDEHARFALLLALGAFELAKLPPDARQTLRDKLFDWYRNDPSSAIHSASGWLLRRWGFQAQVAQVDHTPLPYDKTGKREWFVEEIKIANNQAGSPVENKTIYFTFVVFPPDEFVMGSPDTEAHHQMDEELHKVRLTSPLAVSNREITWEQFSAWDSSHHDRWEEHFERKLRPQDPAFGVSWYEAVRYCRWLTRQADMSEADECYADPDSLTKDADGKPTNWPVMLDRNGFRLPTEAEWEYACRSGMKTAYSFGSDVELLGQYGWFVSNSSDWSHSVAQLRPNLRGLFDVHGNLYEWCHDLFDMYDAGTKDDSVVDPSGPKEGSSRLLQGSGRLCRGGGWFSPARQCRSAYRNFFDRPAPRTTYVGFRVVWRVGGQDSP